MIFDYRFHRAVIVVVVVVVVVVVIVFRRRRHSLRVLVLLPSSSSAHHDVDVDFMVMIFVIRITHLSHSLLSLSLFKTTSSLFMLIIIKLQLIERYRRIVVNSPNRLTEQVPDGKHG